VFAINLDVGDVVFENGGHIDLEMRGVNGQAVREVVRGRTSGNVPLEKTINRQV
jgi:hypothetical protein